MSEAQRILRALGGDIGIEETYSRTVGTLDNNGYLSREAIFGACVALIETSRRLHMSPEQIRAQLDRAVALVWDGHIESAVDRLRAERNRLVETTDLGSLSERLEEDNAATDATLVRSAMYELERLRTLRTWCAREAASQLADDHTDETAREMQRLASP